MRQVQRRLTRRFGLAFTAPALLALIPIGAGLNSVNAQQIYWVDEDGGDIERSPLSGAPRDLVADGLAPPVGLAIWPEGGKVYWTDRQNHRIMRANLDGNQVQAIVTSGPSFPYGVDVAPAAGWVFWTNWNTNVIQRAGLSGGGVVDLISVPSANPAGIAVDSLGTRIYWAEASTDRIRRANFDGTGVQSVVTDQPYPWGVEIDPFEQKVYWTDEDLNQIRRADMDGLNQNVEDLVAIGLSSPRDIALDFDSRKMYWVDRGTGKIQRAGMDIPDGQTAFNRTDIETIVDSGLVTGTGLAIDPRPSPGGPVLFVNQNAVGGNNGLSWPDAFVHLQDALTRASTDVDLGINQIWVAAGVYKPNQGAGIGLSDKSATFQLITGVALFGGFVGIELDILQRDPIVNITRLSGDLLGNDGLSFANRSDNSIHVVTASGVGAGARLDGFHVHSGHAEAGGGFNKEGGGLYSVNGNPVISNCTVSDNDAQLEGGGAFLSGGAPVIINSTFLKNRARDGGGLVLDAGAQSHIVSSSFIGNEATTGSGGAISITTFGPQPPFTTISNCMFSSNTALSEDGGAIFSSGVATTIASSSLWNNSASRGGGVFSSGSHPAIQNSILWGNQASDIRPERKQIDHAQPTGPTLSYSCVEGGSAYGNPTVIDQYPSFVDPDGLDNQEGTVDDNLALGPGSPAIDVGSNLLVPSDSVDLDDDGDDAELTPVDRMGAFRFRDVAGLGSGSSAVVDMGAYEVQPELVDCNGNGMPDDVDIFDETSADCDWDGALSGQPNGVPDECDIATCDPEVAACQDCNLNGVPDGCDIATSASQDVNSDGVPDECSGFIGSCDNGLDPSWSCPANWELGGVYPSDIGNPQDIQPGVHVTLDTSTIPGGADNVVLDADVRVPALRIENGATLEVSGGDLSFSAPPAALLVSGQLLLGDGRSIGATGSTPEVSVVEGGFVGPIQTDPLQNGRLFAESLTIRDATPGANQSLDGGELVLGGEMELHIGAGGLLIDGRSATSGCSGVARGGHTPPVLRVLSAAVVDILGPFELLGSVHLDVAATTPIRLEGDFANDSDDAQCFNCLNGRLRLEGPLPRRFEVAGADVGNSPSGYAGPVGTNFSWGEIEVAGNTKVTFENANENAVGNGACQEALYVGSLILGAGAVVTLDHCRVYYENLMDNGATVSPIGCGALEQVPLDSPMTSDAVCYNGGTPTATPCGTNADCQVGQACRLKSRFLSINPGPGSYGLQVTVIAVPNVPGAVNAAPYNYPAMVGDVWWVGPATVRANDQTPYITAPLECTGTPLVQDWNAVGNIHIYGDAIVPGATYEIRSCASVTGPCSVPLVLSTARNGDVATVYNATDFADISAMVGEFSTPNAPTSLLKPHAWISPSSLTTSMDAPYGFNQISAGVIVFQGMPPMAPPAGANQCP